MTSAALAGLGVLSNVTNDSVVIRPGPALVLVAAALSQKMS